MTQDNDKNTSENTSKDTNKTDQTRVDLGEDLIGELAGELESDKKDLVEPTVLLEVSEIQDAGVLPFEFAQEFLIPIDQQDAEGDGGLIKDLSVDPVTHDDRLESARILIQEGLLDEAKKELYRIKIQKPSEEVEQMFKEIEQIEINQLYRQSAKKRNADMTPIENQNNIIASLNKDLGLVDESLSAEQNKLQPIWRTKSNQPIDIRGLLDLGLGFYEMECFDDALREYKRALNKMRVETSELSDQIVSCVLMIAKCLLQTDRIFEAKVELTNVLNDPSTPLSGRLEIMYTLSECEVLDGQKDLARDWLVRINHIQPNYRDVKIRLRELHEKQKD